MTEQGNVRALATQVISAWLTNSHTRVSAEDLVPVLCSTFETLSELAGLATAGVNMAPKPGPFPPAVSVRKSLGKPDRILSLIDGKAYRSLKRHLAAHGLSPDVYRQRYRLKPDYPMVAPAYSDDRRALAKRIGLGGRRDATTKVPESRTSDG